METTKTNNDGNRMRAAGIAALILLVSTFTSGCTVIDAIDRQLVEWGVVDSFHGGGIDSLAVVQVQAGRGIGVGVVLDGSMIFTANHVVEGRDRVVVKTNAVHSEAYYQVLTARVVYRNRAADQALLVVEDDEALEHTVKLGKARAGEATIHPLRAAGRSAFGETVKRAVVKRVELERERNRMVRNPQIRKGDSGAPIVQNGVVVGLVRGATRMVASDVLENYRLILKARERKTRRGEKIVTTSVPQVNAGAKNSKQS
jgi:hypothetical protein